MSKTILVDRAGLLRPDNYNSNSSSAIGVPTNTVEHRHDPLDHQIVLAFMKDCLKLQNDQNSENKELYSCNVLVDCALG